MDQIEMSEERDTTLQRSPPNKKQRIDLNYLTNLRKQVEKEEKKANKAAKRALAES
jgi:hypothetical protein